MAERRSLTTARMTPEAAAFIQGESKQTQVENVRLIDVVPTSTEEDKPSDKRMKTRSRAIREEQEPGPSDVLDELLVSRTARFQYRTAQALTRAHLERKLKRLRPSSQQEIIELAVQAWLRDRGYLD